MREEFLHQAEEPSRIRLFGTAPDSIVDGPGLRFGVFVQGCPHDCPGCHNPESHDPMGGYEESIEGLVDEIAANKLIHDVTISGGEPFAQPAACATLARHLKERGFGIWVYSGYTYEQLCKGAEEDAGTAELLRMADVLVDGPFIEREHSYTLRWKGSANQRVIDLQKTRSNPEDEVVLWQPPDDAIRF